MKYLIIIFFAIFTVMLSSCDNGPQSPKGFSLPKGDVTKGQVAFLKYECLSCHQLAGFEQPENPEFSVKLGGKTIHVKTYADLLTSIINPSHKFSTAYPRAEIQTDGKSKMKIYNDVMTVSELVDLVTFLQPNYELLPFERTGYKHYSY